jgi:WD40 repeat protein
MIKKPVKVTVKNVLKLHKDTIIGLYSPGGPEGTMLYSCSKEGCVRILDLVEKKIFNTLFLSKSGLNLEDKPTDMGSEIGDLQKIALETTEKVGPKEDLNAVLFTEKTMYGGYEGGDVYCWNLKSGEVIYAMPGHTRAVKQLLKLNPRIIISSSSDNTIRCWDTTSGVCESIIKFDGAINRMLKDGKSLYILIGHNKISILNAETYELVNSFFLEEKVVVNFLVDENTFYIANSNCKIDVFELKDNIFEFKYDLQGHKDWIFCMKMFDNNLYTGSGDKTIKVWSPTEKTLLEEFTDHDDGVVSLEFCDKCLFSGSYDHTIRFWKLEEMYERILDRRKMGVEDLMSRKYEAYCKVMFKGKKPIIAKKVMAKSPSKP